jgi:hypothetical protein
MPELEELAKDGEAVWLWRQAMRVISARERIERQQDANAASHPIEWQKLRLALGEIAYEPDSPEYEWYVSGIAGEQSITFSE